MPSTDSNVALSRRQIILVGAMYTFDSTLISVQSQTVTYAKQHIWLAHIVPALVILLVLAMLVKLLARHPGQDLFAIMDHAKPYIGKPLIMLTVLFFFLIIVRDIRAISEFVNISLLPKTPIYMIGSIVAMTVALICRGGIIVLARMTEIFGLVLSVVVMLLPILMANDIAWMNLMPFWTIDYGGVAMGSWYLFSYVGEVVALAFLCTSSNLTFKRGALAVTLGVGLLIIMSMLGVLVLGLPLMGRMLYPNYELVRHIHLTDFLDRLDLPLIGLWLPTMFVKIGYSLVLVCLGLKRLLPQGSGKALIGPVGFFAFGVSFWFFENSLQLFNFNRTWTGIAIVFEVLLPIAAFLMLYGRKPA